VAAGQGTGQFTTIPLSGAPVRYVRVTLTASSGSWWSVADVRAYTAPRSLSGFDTFGICPSPSSDSARRCVRNPAPSGPGITGLLPTLEAKESRHIGEFAHLLPVLAGAPRSGAASQRPTIPRETREHTAQAADR